MSKSILFALVVAFALGPAVSSASPAEWTGCRLPAMTPAVAAEPEPPQPFLLPDLSRAELDRARSSGVDHTCCEQAAAECEWRCTQGIRTFWCESDACGPGCCAVQCDCWIFE